MQVRHRGLGPPPRLSLRAQAYRGQAEWCMYDDTRVHQSTEAVQVTRIT